MIDKAYIALGGLIGVLVLSFFVYNWGWDNRDLKAQADQKVAIEAALVTYKKRVTQAINAANNFEQDKLELESYNGKLEERIQAYINKPFNSDRSCLDANGVQLFNDISKGRDTSDTSSIKKTMPKGFTEISRWEAFIYLDKQKRYIQSIRNVS